MGYSFLESIKKIGIFLICAESILHFMPGNSYQKYVKFLVGIMVLAQFVIPIRAIVTGQQKETIEQEMEQFQKLLEVQDGELGSDGLNVESPESKIENEYKEIIKSKLNNVAENSGYMIKDVIIDKIIYVIVSDADKSGIQIQGDPIYISPIQINQDDNSNSRQEDGMEELKKKFCQEMGTEEAYMEVIWDGGR